MVRESKFRGQRYDDKTWIYGSLLENDIIVVKGATDVDVDYIGFSDEWSSVLPETVGEYTGLHDGKHADGNEIYEGDICKDDKGDIVAIEWNDENFCFSCRIIKGCTLTMGLLFPLWQFNNCQMNGYRYLTIIGNVHDNPELLKRQAVI